MNTATQAALPSTLDSHAAIAAVLASAGDQIERVGRSTWRVALDAAAAVAHIDGEWFVLSAVTPGPHHRLWNSQRDLAALLARNGRLPPGIKYALAGDELSAELRGELLLDGDTADEPAATDDVAGLVDRFRHAAQTSRAATANTAPVLEPEALESLSLAAGWPCVVRATGEIDVTLEDPRAHRCASVRSTQAGVRLSVPLSIDPDAIAADVRGHALAVFLLRATGALHLARATLERHASAPPPAFEVLLAATPRALDVGHGLAALSVACERFGREAEALAQDAQLADAYLDLTGVQDDRTMPDLPPQN